MPTILVTGGAGYIGSHTCVSLLAAGHRIVVVDNLSNASAVAVDRVRDIAGGQIELHTVDLRDASALDVVFNSTPIDAVIHFAAKKAVGESVEIPLEYYDNNIVGLVNLLKAMRTHDVNSLVFSSSCTVYGDPETVPVTEATPVTAINPYGRTKLFAESILQDVAAAHGIRVVALRYFNPVGAHESGMIGEDPEGIPNNLMPFAMQVAVGRRDELAVFGDDYTTPDGTCIRDYIHVVDLADAHVAAIGALDRVEGFEAVNVGTGTGSSVLEVVAAVSRAIGSPLPHSIVGRRAGDAPCIYADTDRATELLGWTATRNLDDMCRDHHRWQVQNPSGYTPAER